eukprot:m.433169 g.433169  ORF g.433169 m.433169 type:complete len:562 (-) comp21417_c0_seq4:1306-2991(-)
MGLLKEKWFVSWDSDPAQRMMRSKKSRDEQIADADLTWSANQGTWTYVTPDSLLLKSKYNPQRFLHTFPGGVAAYLRLMRDNFGVRFMVMLTSVYFGVKGFIWRFGATNGQLFYFRYLGINSNDYAAYRVAAMAPWSMKAFIGAIADSMPFLGFHKRSYIVAVSSFGVIGAIGLAAFDLDASKVKVATLFFLFLNLQMAVVDLLTEGKYAEIMSHRPKTGGAVVSWVWSVYLTANLLATVIIGLMVEHGYTREMYWAVVPFSMQVLIPVIIGYFPELRLPPHKRGFNWGLVKTNRNFFSLALLMAVGSVIMTICNLELNDDWKSLLAVAVVLSAVLCTTSLLLLPKVLGKSIVYLFLSSALYVDISPALNYFYLADDSCVPGGPHFDSTYYNIYVGIMESLAGILGVTLFHAVMNGWHFRPTFWVTVVLRCAAGMFDLIMVKRWNKDVNIPDKVMFMMGATIVYNVAYMMEFMYGVLCNAVWHCLATLFAVLKRYGHPIRWNLQDCPAHGSAPSGCCCRTLSRRRRFNFFPPACDSEHIHIRVFSSLFHGYAIEAWHDVHI